MLKIKYDSPYIIKVNFLITFAPEVYTMDIMPNRFAKKNDIIFREGDAPDGVYYITSGRVKVLRNIGGIETEIAELEEDDVFGELAMTDDRPRSATVVAAADCSFYVLSRSAFENKLKSLDQLMYTVFLRMALSIRNMNYKFEELHRQRETTPTPTTANTSDFHALTQNIVDTPPFNDVSMIKDYIDQPRFK